MVRKYQKSKRKSSKEKKKLAEELQQNSLAEINQKVLNEMLEEGITQVCLDVGKVIVEQFLQKEVSDLCGSRYQRSVEGEHYRYGSEQGYGYIAGQKIPVLKPRVRTKTSKEVPLLNYEKIKNPQTFTKDVSRRLLCGVSCRDYDKVIDKAGECFGISKSSVSRSFKAATRSELEKLLSRDLSRQQWVVVYIDGKAIGGEMIIIAIGVAITGEKQVLGFRQGSTENKSVVSGLLTDLKERGLNGEEGLLFLLDGSKALKSAVVEHYEGQCFIQRCRVHKKRNVLDHVPKGQQMMINQLLSAAYKERNIDQARLKLNSLITKLEKYNPDAAGSLKEGLEESLTVLKFNLPEKLTKSLLTTNAIESMLSVASNLMKRVKRWRGGDMRKRWIGAGLLRAEQRCKKLRGYKHLRELSKSIKYELEKIQFDKQEEIA